MPSRTFVFFFNDTATTEIYTLSLHDALPIYCHAPGDENQPIVQTDVLPVPPEQVGLELILDCPHSGDETPPDITARSEEHTSELQSRQYLVCRLLLEKKK